MKLPRPFVAVIASCLGAGTLSGCWLTLDLDDKEFTLVPGDGGAGGGVGGAGGASATTTTGGHAGMVEVKLPDQTSFFIDATEVTVSAYAAWLATSPTTTMQAPRCEWNDSFVPGECEPGSPCGCDGSGITLETEINLSPDLPVRCVDFCDAVAYCEGNGKHLCGGIGGVLLAGSPDPSNDPMQSEWFFACSKGGTRAFPYGDNYAAGTCIDATVDSARPREVGTRSCEGGIPGVFDMSGNVEEWIDHCYIGTNQACFRPGGGYWHDTVDNFDCELWWEQSTDMREQSPATGFRCCDVP